MSREPLFVALFNLITTLKTNGVVKDTSRKLKHWNDVPGEDQPIIFMAQGDQEPTVKSWDLPYGWSLKVKLYIYVHVADEITAPASVLNVVLDALEAVLKPIGPSGKLTLGGLCEACFIDGTVETFEGTLGNQEVAIVPITINVR